MRSSRLVPRILSLAALATMGCATEYTPRQSPRIAVVTDARGVGYVKDGVRYAGGMFGGEIEEAVQGVPEAERHSRAYGKLMTVGTTIEIVGLGLAVGGPIVNETVGSTNATTRRNVDSALLLGGTAIMLTGLLFIVAARPHLYDAANIYNDCNDAPRNSDPLQLSRCGSAVQREPTSGGSGRVPPLPVPPRSWHREKAAGIESF
jgi:hypothetical protein